MDHDRPTHLGVLGRHDVAGVRAEDLVPSGLVYHAGFECAVRIFRVGVADGQGLVKLAHTLRDLASDPVPAFGGGPEVLPDLRLGRVLSHGHREARFRVLSRDFGERPVHVQPQEVVLLEDHHHSAALEALVAGVRLRQGLRAGDRRCQHQLSLRDAGHRNHGCGERSWLFRLAGDEPDNQEEHKVELAQHVHLRERVLFHATHAWKNAGKYNKIPI